MHDPNEPVIRQALERALATLNPLGGFLRQHPQRGKTARHLESVRHGLRTALARLGADKQPAGS